MFVVAMIAILAIAAICESRAGRRAGRLAKGLTERTVSNLERWADGKGRGIDDDN